MLFRSATAALVFSQPRPRNQPLDQLALGGAEVETPVSEVDILSRYLVPQRPSHLAVMLRRHIEPPHKVANTMNEHQG